MDSWARFVAEGGPAPELDPDRLADLRVDGALRALGRAARDAEDFTQGVLLALRAKRDETRFVARVETALRARKRRAAPWAAAAAAALLLGLLVSSPPRPAPFARLGNGAPLAPGQGLETGDASATVAWAHGGRLELAPRSAIAEISPSSLRLLRGAVELRSPRPVAVATAHGEASGPLFRLEVGSDGRRPALRLETAHEAAAFRGQAVPPGHALAVSPSGETALRPAPIDEIALLPARASPGPWRAVPDDQASGGAALEPAPGGALEFRFAAEANKEYAVSLRARALGPGRPELVLEPEGGLFSARCAGSESAPLRAFAFDGRLLGDDYAWIDEGRARAGPDLLPDLAPAVLRFRRPGVQVLRLAVSGAPVRVDAIRLQATKRTGSGSLSFQ